MSIHSVGCVCLLLQDHLSNIPVNTSCRHTLPRQCRVDFYSCSHTFHFFPLLCLSLMPKHSAFTQLKILIRVCFVRALCCHLHLEMPLNLELEEFLCFVLFAAALLSTFYVLASLFSGKSYTGLLHLNKAKKDKGLT